MYGALTVKPMRDELTTIGFADLRTPELVDQTLKQPGTTLLVINSVCGCAAGNARPGVTLALKHNKLPQHLATVFAGQDKEATDRARSYFSEQPSSSPSFALLKDGKLIYMMHRHQIEGSSADQIARELTKAFDQYC